LKPIYTNIYFEKVTTNSSSLTSWSLLIRPVLLDLEDAQVLSFFGLALHDRGVRSYDTGIWETISFHKCHMFPLLSLVMDNV